MPGNRRVRDKAGGRRRIAGYLAGHGPTWGDAIAAALGMTLDEFWPLINCPWFRMVVGGYGLSARGRAEALGGESPA